MEKFKKCLCGQVCKEKTLEEDEEMSIQKDFVLQHVPKILILGSDKSRKYDFFSVLTKNKISIINEQMNVRLETSMNKKQTISSSLNIFSEQFITEYPEQINNAIRQQDGVILIYTQNNENSQKFAYEELQKYVSNRQSLSRNQYILILEVFSKSPKLNEGKHQNSKYLQYIQGQCNINHSLHYLKLDINDEKSIKKYYQIAVNGTLRQMRNSEFISGNYQSTVTHYSDQSVISPESFI